MVWSLAIAALAICINVRLIEPALQVDAISNEVKSFLPILYSSSLYVARPTQHSSKRSEQDWWSRNDATAVVLVLVGSRVDARARRARATNEMSPFRAIFFAALLLVSALTFADAQDAKPASRSDADAAPDAAGSRKDALGSREEALGAAPETDRSSKTSADECGKFWDAFVRCEADPETVARRLAGQDPENFTRRLQGPLLVDDDNDDSVCGLADVILAGACGSSPQDACEMERRDYTPESARTFGYASRRRRGGDVDIRWTEGPIRRRVAATPRRRR